MPDQLSRGLETSPGAHPPKLMAFGPGKYDELCSEVRIKANARGVILIVISGDKGNGFSCQADMKITLSLADILEDVARQIRESGPTL